VLFFKALTRLFALFGKKDVKFHPDEITRVRSRAHVIGLVEGAGLKVLDYAFGPRDLFTYVVVIGQLPPPAAIAAA
jgi:hypothetical protein